MTSPAIRKSAALAALAGGAARAKRVVAPNYLIVYRVQGDTVRILRVLHARQQWP